MPAFIDENTQFAAEGGLPLAGGQAFFGIVNLDPEPIPNRITIFSDRDLTIALPNPITLNAEGRTTSKVWIPNVYSLLVKDVVGVQHLLELDQGEAEQIGIINLISVQGTNDITADASPAVSVLVDKALYIFQAIGANTNVDGVDMTLTVGTTTTHPIKQNVTQSIPAGKIEDTQTIIVAFNEGALIFEWVNHSDKVLYLTNPTDVVSAATTDIWSPLGNDLHIDLGSSPVSSFGTAQKAGAFRYIQTTGIITFTNSANLICPGGVDLISASGDTFQVIADSPTIARIIQYQRASVEPLKPFIFTGAVALSGTSELILSGLIDVETIFIEFDDFSTDTNNRTALLQLGDSGGLETAGYSGRGWSVNVTPGVSEQVNTDGFNLGNPPQQDTGQLMIGSLILTHMGSNRWQCTYQGSKDDQALFYGYGTKTLTGLLTQISLTSSAGDATISGNIYARHK